VFEKLSQWDALKEIKTASTSALKNQRKNLFEDNGKTTSALSTLVPIKIIF